MTNEIPVSKSTYQCVTLAVALLVVEQQVRQQAASELDDAQLLDSVRQYGILQPLGVRFDGKHYTVVWGHRRLKAAIAAGLKDVPCVILDREMSEGKFLLLQMQENIQRVDISSYDLWQGCVRLQGANPEWKMQDIASALAISPGHLTRVMSPSKCIPAWQQALKVGKATFDTCYIASRLSEDRQEPLLAFMLATGANRKQLEAAAAEKPAPQAEEETKTSSIRIAVGNVVITVKGAKLTLGAVTELLVKASKQTEVAQNKGWTTKTAEDMWKQEAAKAQEDAKSRDPQLEGSGPKKSKKRIIKSRPQEAT